MVEPNTGAFVVGAVGQVFGSALDKRAASKARRARRKQRNEQIKQLKDQNTQQLEGARRLAGRQRASFGAAGVRSGFGTAAAAQGLTMADAMLTQSRIMKGVRNLQLANRDDRRAVHTENVARTFGTFLNVLGAGINTGVIGNSSPSATTASASPPSSGVEITNQGTGMVG